MPDFNLANIRTLTGQVKKTFDGLKTPTADYADIATVVNTKSHTVNYAWLATVPSMKEWIGSRDEKTLADRTYHIVKKDWEATISVMRDDFLFDNLGLVKPKVQQLHHSVVKHYNTMVHSLITANGNCFDGQPFFGAHDVAGTTYDNSGTASLSEEALFDVIGMMSGIKDEEGEPLGIEPNRLLIAPNLLKTAKTILGSKVIAGSDNIAHNLLELKVVASMPANSWCVLDTTQPLKPFILQISKKGKVEEDTTKMFSEKRVIYGVDTMDSAGYGFWQMAFFSDGTA